MQHQGYNDALEAVQRRLEVLAPRISGDDPRTLYSRIVAHIHAPTHDNAVRLAALAVALVAAIDRAESADITTGEAA